MIDVRGLHKSYGDSLVLDGINFSVNSGEIFGLVGINGSGKSTIISILAGDLACDKGDIAISTEAVVYVPQKMVFFEHLSVKGNLELFASGLYNAKEAGERISRVMQMFSLEAEAKKLVKSISEGNKRKLNMAISFLKDGDVYLLDEPIVNIDYESRKRIESVLMSLRDGGKTVVLVSHNRNFIESVCDRVLFLENSKQVYLGELNEEVLERL